MSFAVRDELTGMIYPCYASGKTAISIANRIKVDEPIHWICNILCQPDSRTNGETFRVTFRVITWDRQ